MSGAFQKISAIALVLLTFGVAELTGGNGFVAAFAFGVTVGNWRKAEQSPEIFEYVEVEVQILMLLTFLIFGAVLLPPALEQVDAAILLFAVLSLAVVRIPSVALSFLGSKVRPATTLFVGWFGPKGIASILYIFTVMDSEALAGKEVIYTAAMITVLLSIFAHGVTAAPLANWYGNRMTEVVDPDARERKEVPEMPLRTEPVIQPSEGAG
jgi:NhaP-type Na+/H+ or K+/H+ antiporter